MFPGSNAASAPPPRPGCRAGRPRWPAGRPRPDRPAAGSRRRDRPAAPDLPPAAPSQRAQVGGQVSAVAVAAARPARSPAPRRRPPPPPRPGRRRPRTGCSHRGVIRPSPGRRPASGRPVPAGPGASSTPGSARSARRRAPGPAAPTPPPMSRSDVFGPCGETAAVAGPQTVLTPAARVRPSWVRRRRGTLSSAHPAAVIHRPRCAGSCSRPAPRAGSTTPPGTPRPRPRAVAKSAGSAAGRGGSGTAVSAGCPSRRPTAPHPPRTTPSPGRR